MGKNCRHPSGAGQPLRSCAPWRERRQPAFWCGGFWDNRRHYSVAGQIGTAAGQRRNRRNDPAQSWRPKSAGQGAGKEDRHGAQSGRSRGRTENELNDFPPALRKSQVLGGIFNRTLQKMIRIYKEKLSPYTPSKITAHKTIKTLPTRKGLLAGGNCDAVNNEYGGNSGSKMITV